MRHADARPSAPFTGNGCMKSYAVTVAFLFFENVREEPSQKTDFLWEFFQQGGGCVTFISILFFYYNLILNKKILKDKFLIFQIEIPIFGEGVTHMGKILP